MEKAVMGTPTLRAKAEQRTIFVKAIDTMSVHRRRVSQAVEPPERIKEAAHRGKGIKRDAEASCPGNPPSDGMLRLHSTLSGGRALAAELASLVSLWGQNAAPISSARTANDNHFAGPFGIAHPLPSQ
jgi:hypothetical protein